MLRPTSLALCVAALACTAPPADELDEVIVDPDGKADAASEIRARIDGLSVWVDAAMIAKDGGWVIEGRASKNLDGVASWVPDDAFAQATLTGPRTFEVKFEPGHELNTLLSGLPIFLDLDPKNGANATAAVWVAPRLTSMTGSSKIYLHTAIEPIWVAYELVYRGKATLTTGWGELQVWTDDGPAPQSVSTGDRAWRIDFGYEALAGGLGAGRPVHAAASKAGAPVEKSAAIALKVTKLGLTGGDAAQVWERTCDDDVADCLAALPDGTVDTSACGSYREVQACGGLDVPEAPAGVTMADDLRAHLVGWYADHGADVASAGGNTLAQAQAAVAANGFTRVTTADEDPEAHDQATTWVYRHADVVYPGSDIAWFVAYDKGTGALLRVYDFN